jgi:hypothetical protein
MSSHVSEVQERSPLPCPVVTSCHLKSGDVTLFLESFWRFFRARLAGGEEDEVTSSTRRWGKAGVRLTDAEAIARDARNRAERNQSAARRTADDEHAHRAWAEGRVVPHSITIALDSRSLYGPEVDEACGAKEPDVDRWEAGDLYPTWEQLRKLAELCGVTPRFFTTSHRWIDPRETTLRFHLPAGTDLPDPPVLFFPQPVVDATVGAQQSAPPTRR